MTLVEFLHTVRTEEHTAEGAEPFMKLALDSISSSERKFFTLQNYKLSDQQGILVYDTLSSLRYNDLRGIILKNVSLQDHHIHFLIPLITTHNLEVVDLSSNLLTHTGCSILCGALSSSQHLDTLDLSWNPIGQYGGYAIAQLCEVNTSLRTLIMNNCDVTLEVIVALMSVLRGHPSISSISLGNPILSSHQEENVYHIARMLEINEKVTSLSLPGNK